MDSKEGSSSGESPSSTQRLCLDISDFECALCYRVYHQPTTVPCGHTFCKTCIMAAAQKKPQCPMCRARIPSKTFPVNFTIDRIIERNFPEKYSVMRRREAMKGKKVLDDEGETGKNDQGLFDCFACF